MLVLFTFRKEVDLLKDIGIDVKTFITAVTGYAEGNFCPDKKDEYSSLINLVAKVPIEDVVETLRSVIWNSGDIWSKEESSHYFWESVLDKLEYDGLSPDEKETVDMIPNLLSESAVEVFGMVDFFFSSRGWWGDYRHLVNHEINKKMFETCVWLDSFSVTESNLASIIFENYEKYLDDCCMVDSSVYDYICEVLPVIQLAVVTSQIHTDVGAFIRGKTPPKLSTIEKEILDVAIENLKTFSDEIEDIVRHPEAFRE